MKTNNKQPNIIGRPPVICIMGHIDHGKSTLLDCIRKTTVAEKEVGGITQRISAYEIIHKNKSGKENKITFLDTPGHEAFCAIRERGVDVADIAVLVVSAEDGVKKQTLEALTCIKDSGIPYIVAINKIDKPGADVEKTKQNLAENEIYLEGYGGAAPWVPISAKTGEGVSELLDMMLLVAEMGELTGDANKNAEGVVIEANLDSHKGISGTLIIKDGALKSGMFIASGGNIASTRLIEDFTGERITEARFSSPIKVVGWNELPAVGAAFKSFETKKEAENYVAAFTENIPAKKNSSKEKEDDNILSVDIILKAETMGSIEAIEHEIKKIKNDKVRIKIIRSGIGDISENDVKTASAKEGAVILGFDAAVDPKARNYAERLGVEIKVFDVIYKLSEWIEAKARESTPKFETEETSGVAKIIRVFSKSKDKYVIGGKVESGLVSVGEDAKILRRDQEVGKGKIKELQHQKKKVSEIKEGMEFGCQIQAAIEIAPGDKIESYKIVQK
ncbi:MAG: translation initiation factor IF-2 [Patescibacteria group bacterium]|nr:translation initiation factor IF-2 [Patescibacteria group bacterium]MDE1988104.1 translation initiation factor IF-2 [Patescibacteria group bacterium]MDE2218209.1 translation initiation factor IF-2 [Patescibacteria group bacterium]